LQHIRLQAKDGTERVWLYRNVRFEEVGSAPCVLDHALDITDRILAERTLKRSQQDLAKASDELMLRVAERTAELQQSNERLQAEIEQRRQVEEELLQARKLEALSVLAGGIAHDFNNFLAIVRGRSTLPGFRHCHKILYGRFSNMLMLRATVPRRWLRSC
jgi:C4-dicarboxylate-specific signal transduction histidine kinase